MIAGCVRGTWAGIDNEIVVDGIILSGAVSEPRAGLITLAGGPFAVDQVHDPGDRSNGIERQLGCLEKFSLLVSID
jgi:hypothetical protein